MNNVYFDNSATTKTDERVIEAIYNRKLWKSIIYL